MAGAPVISSRKVKGTAVFDDNGDRLGAIENLYIDKNSAVIRYAVLEFGGLFGIGTERCPVPWSMLKYVELLNGYLVPISRARLANAPRYTPGKLFEETVEYGRMVYGHYGVDWEN